MTSTDTNAGQDGSFAREAIERSEAFRREKRFRESIAVLLGALKVDGDCAELYQRLGNIRFDSGDLEQAEVAYKRALTLDPNHENAMHNLSVVYKRQRRMALFVRTYRRSKRLGLSSSRSDKKAARGRGFLGGFGGRAFLYVVGLGAALLLAWVLSR
ncbi:MAG: tetratricopeptide repeat protein [Candidatus Bipolaricaulia bacterium]